MEEVLEDYKRRLKTLDEELQLSINTDGDIAKISRLTIKRGCYKTFISELEREIAIENPSKN